ITNQRETTVVWDRLTGKPIANAIVWQDRRTAEYCDGLRRAGHEPMVQEATGLLIDSYFSASKLRWLLDNVPDARTRAEAGELAFGTIDSFLLWRLSGGKSHCTDATNASRTQLFNITSQEWDERLLTLFGIPDSLLPQVKDCASDFGTTDPALFGARIPIAGMIGDQQAAAFGQCCFDAGMAKSTYGTGCFLLMNTGANIVRSEHRLLSTVAYRLNGVATYAVEGSIFMAGATMQWIRDGLKLIDDAAASEALAIETGDELSVYLVPAFTGLGAPYWDAEARGALYGLTRDTGIKEVVTAGLLSVCYQTRDLVEAIRGDGATLENLRVDGGMANNDWVMQKLADVLGCNVQRPTLVETTALGAAYMACLQLGLVESLDALAARWQLDSSWQQVQSEDWRVRHYTGWLEAVDRTRSSG
ncbi:glycerol kinase, partial [Gammaproteobacteria bacterium]|nr:glycerol kinase [Gammaproteobacteria bacterium]